MIFFLTYYNLQKLHQKLTQIIKKNDIDQNDSLVAHSSWLRINCKIFGALSLIVWTASIAKVFFFSHLTFIRVIIEELTHLITFFIMVCMR